MPVSELEKTWAERAARLARPVEQEDLGEQVHLLRLRLGEDICALPVDGVSSIHPLGRLTRVPRVPAWVAGVTNLHGRIVSVVSLSEYLNLPAAQPADGEGLQHLVVVEGPAMELALIVDEVLAVEAVPRLNIQQPAGVVQGLPAQLVRGIYVDGPVVVVIIDLQALLVDPRLIIHEDVH
ncbi:MAG: chemotaxis protein CheW [Chloroflexota bacterium]